MERKGSGMRHAIFKVGILAVVSATCGSASWAEGVKSLPPYPGAAPEQGNVDLPSTTTEGRPSGAYAKPQTGEAAHEETTTPGRR